MGDYITFILAADFYHENKCGVFFRDVITRSTDCNTTQQPGRRQYSLISLLLSPHILFEMQNF